MHPRLFRLLETYQRIEDRLRALRLRPAPGRGEELARLLFLKARARRLIGRLTSVQPAGA